MFDLKAVERNVQCSLRQELLLYEIELSHSGAEVTKNICFANGEGAVNHITVSRRFKKFHSFKKTSIRKSQVSQKLWIAKPCSKPKRQIQRVALGEYKISSAFRVP